MSRLSTLLVRQQAFASKILGSVFALVGAIVNESFGQIFHSRYAALYLFLSKKNLTGLRKESDLESSSAVSLFPLIETAKLPLCLV